MLNSSSPLPAVHFNSVFSFFLYRCPANPAQPATGWDADFMDVSNDLLFDLIGAANFLDIRPLLDLTCKTLAAHIRGKTTEELQQHFNIKCDLSAAEVEELRINSPWNTDIS
eukprot:m.72938 g.72938  ORF g.72938 m.72938 type:complete len:112 (+) comp17000_c0_seq3:101-436(+)